MYVYFFIHFKTRLSSGLAHFRTAAGPVRYTENVRVQTRERRLRLES